MHFATLLVSAGLVHLSIAGYTLEDDYSAANFFSMFNFQTVSTRTYSVKKNPANWIQESDPTGGYVNYLDQPTAQSDGLINTNNGLVYIGVDNTNVASGRGRNSVRLESKKTYTHALIVLDLAHMPAGCGTWPAFWTFGPSWPNLGEIDVIEGVNDQTTNSMTLHTSDGCSANSPAGAFTGQQNTYNCYVGATNQSANEGCGFSATADNSYGAGFNSNGGGVYAMEWTSDYIQIFFWPGGSAPSDALGDTPNPSSWGRPAALFQGNCDIDQHFSDHQITFDMTFCGSWAGDAWGDGNCAAQHGNSCNAFVQNTPSAFKETYWSVNSLRVYQNSPSSNTAPSAASKPQPAAIPAAVPEASSVSSAASAPQSTSTTSTTSSTLVASSSTHSVVTVTAAPVIITIAAPSTTLAPKTSSVYSSQAAPTLDVLPANAEVLQSDEFGAGSPGIPDPWRRRNRRHLAQHIRSAHAHL
ncbi:hypothetical protein MMC34_001549 [Xylographa carneopallida]|nr:hypothetical protein [Xylographa carneopallida]